MPFDNFTSFLCGLVRGHDTAGWATVQARTRRGAHAACGGGVGGVATTVHGLYCNRIVARLSKVLQDLTAVRCVAMILPPGPWYRPRNGARRLLRGFNPVLNLAYNIKSYAHILISKLSFSFNYLLFSEKCRSWHNLYP